MIRFGLQIIFPAPPLDGKAQARPAPPRPPVPDPPW